MLANNWWWSHYHKTGSKFVPLSHDPTVVTLWSLIAYTFERWSTTMLSVRVYRIIDKDVIVYHITNFYVCENRYFNGLTETSFKEKSYKHKMSFKLERCRIITDLSNYHFIKYIRIHVFCPYAWKYASG